MRGVRWVGDDNHFVFRQKLLGEDGIVRWVVVMVKQPGPFSPKFGAASSHVFTQSPQNVALEPGIHSLACLDRCYHNCSVNCGTSPEYFRYHLVYMLEYLG
jgi:hypothetical protein